VTMRDRIEIEAEADKARPGPSSPPRTEDLVLEVLLDIRDRLGKMHVEQLHQAEAIGLLRDISGKYPR
jgi:hypothetical protein